MNISLTSILLALACLVLLVAALVLGWSCRTLAGRRLGARSRRLWDWRQALILTLIGAGFALAIACINRWHRELIMRQFQNMELYDAHRVANEIEGQIRIIHAQLAVLARNPDIIRFNESGKDCLRDYFDLADHRLIRNISRVSSQMRLMYTFPPARGVGADLSGQPHNQRLMRELKPLVGNPFVCVQGFRAVAVVQPVVEGSRFAGSVTALIDLDVFLRRFVTPVTTGGLALTGVISNDGILLAHSDRQFSGQLAAKVAAKFPSMLEFIQRMRSEPEGTARYTFDRLRGQPVPPDAKAAAFARARLNGEDFWTVFIMASEAEILAKSPYFHWPLLIVGVLFLLTIALVMGERLRDEWRYAGTLEEEIQLRLADLRRSEDQVQRISQDRMLLATAVEQAAEGIYITDTSGIIQYINPAFTRLTGFSPEDALGRHPRFLDRDRRDRDFYRNLGETLMRGQRWSGHFTIQAKDGTVHQLEAAISPVRDEDGQVRHFVAVNRDATQERVLEAQLIQAQKMDAIGKLAGGVAHDFNNILTGVMGNLMMLQRMAGENAQRYIAEATQACDRASDLVRQLLTFARKSPGTRHPLPLNLIVLEAVALARKGFDRRIRLETALAEELPRILADPNQIHQVIMNLCVNARDAIAPLLEVRDRDAAFALDSPTVYRVTVSTEERQLVESELPALADAHPGRFVRLTVADNGIGMDAQVQARIFEPFFTTKEPEKGTGLGLATVYGIVKNHGGWIEVVSQPGEGAAFHLYFPAAPEKSAGEADEIKEVVSSQ